MSLLQSRVVPLTIRCITHPMPKSHVWWFSSSKKDSEAAWKKISVITDISVFRFYGYIGYIGDISVDILEKNIGKLKIVKNS